MPSSDDARADEADVRPPSDQPSLSLADRFTTVLESGRLIASALSPERIYEEVHHAAVRLLRAEHCLVVKVDPSTYPQQFVPWGEPAAPFAEDVLVRAVAEQRTVSSLKELAEETSERVVFAGEQAVLCTPVLARGNVAACLYLVRQQVHDRFSPDEQRLAEFIATLAGAALENAEGFSQLQCLNETLEQRVSERTAAAEARAQELAESNRQLHRTATDLRQTEEQLRVAMNAAEQASLAKTQFLATMSHEIRTPMNGILGMAELALATSLTPLQQDYLRTVKQSGHALLRLLNDILDFSKIEAGRLDLEEVAFDLPSTVADAVRLLAFDAQRKGLELAYRVDPQLPRDMRGDPGRLRQVLVNLIGNALKFTEAGKVFLDVRLERPGDHCLTVHFVVRDTGIGIPAAQQELIFERFRQADGSTTRRYGGSGLGLAISAQLVALMGGRIWVESEVGVGSEFHFTADFPQCPNSPSGLLLTEDRTGDTPEAIPAPDQAVHPLRILLAEDGPINQVVAVGLLEMRGHQVVVADNGKEVARPARHRGIRCRPDGSGNAADGWHGSDAANPPAGAAKRRASADYRDDGTRTEPVPRRLPPGRHGRLPDQTHPAGGTRRRAGQRNVVCHGLKWHGTVMGRLSCATVWNGAVWPMAHANHCSKPCGRVSWLSTCVAGHCWVLTACRRGGSI